MNASERLLQYISKPAGTYGYFDIDDDYIKWVTGKEQFDPIEDRIAFCNSVNNPCVINFGDITQYINELKPKRKIISEDEQSITKKIYYESSL